MEKQPKQELVSRIVTYVLHKRGDKAQPYQVNFGSLALDSTYAKGGPRSAISLLDYINKAAFDEATKDPVFCEKHGTNPDDFFVTVQYEFRL